MVHSPLRAPYPGTSKAFNALYSSGCGTANAPVKWKFKLSTGVGVVAENGKAGVCKNAQPGVTYSSAQSSGSFEAQIPVRVAAGTTNVTANLAATYAISVLASDTTREFRRPTCVNGLTTSSSEYLGYAWNGTYHSYGFGNYTAFPLYNDTFTSSNGGNYTYSNAPVPVPFYLNRTTSYVDDRSYSASGSCAANVFAEVNVHSSLKDLTARSFITRTSDSFAPHDTLFLVELSVSRSIAWGCKDDEKWVGFGAGYPGNGSQGSYTISRSCYNHNSTLVSTETTAYPSATSNGTNATLSWSSSSNVAGALTWISSYSAAHHYLLELNVSATLAVDNSWESGIASYGLDMGLGSNGIELVSVSET
jgi:hypothetical protein